MFPLRPFSRSLVLAGLVALVATVAPAVTPAAAESPCPPGAVAVDLGLQDLSFTARDRGGYLGIGSAATVVVDAAGVDLLVQEVGESGGAADLSLAFDAASLAPAPVEGSAGAAVTRLDALGATSATGWGELATTDLYPGVDLSISATHRRLWLRLDADSADALASVRLVAPGAAIRPRDADTVTLSTDVLASTEQAAPRRSFDLDLVALEVAGGEERRLGARLFLDQTPDGESSIGIALDDRPVASKRGGVRVFLTALLGPYQPAVDAERLADGGAIAASSARLVAGDARRAVLLTRLDADGATVASTVVDAGAGVTISGLAVDPASDSADRLHLAGSSLGKAWLATVDLESGQLETSAALDALRAADDVLVDAKGRVRVVGRADGSFVAVENGSSREMVVALPAVETGEASETLVVAEIAGDHVVEAATFEVAPLRRPVRAWIDCRGTIHFGTPWWQATTQSVQHTYSIDVPSSDMQNCPRIDESHGFGALCWKARKSVTNWTYHPWNVSGAVVPSALVFVRDPNDPSSTGVADYERFNQLEANAHGNLFFHVPTTTWDDPGGAWYDPWNWAYSKAEIAVAAAVYQERWNSPIFANLRVPDGVNPAGLRAVMLRAETFSAPSQGQMPHEICDEDSDNDGSSDFSGDPWPSPPEYQVAAACVAAHGSAFTLESIDYDTWRVGTAYVPDQTVQGSAAGWWPFFTPYVGDPPVPAVGDPGARPAHLREMSRRLSERVRVPATIVLSTISGGRVVSTETIAAEVAAAAID